MKNIKHQLSENGLDLLLMAIVVGIYFAALYWNLPPVRHSILAIKTAIFLSDIPLNISSYVKNATLTYGKPLGLSLFMHLFYSIIKSPSAFYYSSAALGILHNISSFFLAKTYKEELGSNYKLCLILWLFNPWAIYHFYGLAPDVLYLLFVNIFLILVHDKYKKHIVLIGLTILMAIVVRLHALILIGLWPILTEENVFSKKYFSSKSFVMVLVIGLILFISFLGWNPLINLTSKAGGGRGDYFNFSSNRMHLADYGLNLLQFFIFLITTFSFFIFYIKNTILEKRLSKWAISSSLILFSLLIYRWSYHNTRYFLMLIPFMSFLVFDKKNRFQPWIVFFSFSALVFTNYVVNISPEILLKQLKLSTLNNGTFDNLRLVQRRLDLEKINQFKNFDCQKNQCFVVDHYYGSAFFGIYETLGYWPIEKNVKYLLELSEVPLDSKNAFIWYRNIDDYNLDQAMYSNFSNNQYRVEKLDDELYEVIKR